MTVSATPRFDRSVSVVVPVFNSSATLVELCRRITEVARAEGYKHEIILVNDGSRDCSWEVIRALVEGDSAVRGIDLSHNCGQHAALLTGVRAARFPVVVTLDDDLQHPPDQIPVLLAQLDDEVDVVYGTLQPPQHGSGRNVVTRITKIVLQTAMGSDIASMVSPFRAFRVNLREAFEDYRNGRVSLDVLLSWSTTRFVSVPVRHEARSAGASNYTTRQLAHYAVDVATGFSTRPLRIASLIGFLFSGFGFLMLIIVVGRRVLQGNQVPGFPFIASLMSIFAGAQLFALGIIGEYVARIHLRLMDRPLYRVREAIGDETTI